MESLPRTYVAMLRFFSKLRHTLLGQGKLLRYLTYAVGEIILVVVGILIALQVNIWNQARKDRQSELLVLAEIRSDLKMDVDEFNRNMTHLKNQGLSTLRLLEIARDDLPYDESYGAYLFYSGLFPRFTPKTAGYELLQSKGLDLVSDDELRRAITDLYKFGYPYIQAKERDLQGFQSVEVAPASRKYKGLNVFSRDLIPEDIINRETISIGRFSPMRNFEAFKKDEDFLSILKASQAEGESYLFSHEYSLQEIKDLLEKLDKALDGAE